MTGNGIILIVEDDFDIADSLKDALGDAGYALAWCEDGQQALEYLQAHPPPRLILLDLMMQGMNGFQFRREQLSQPGLANIPVVVMTASRDRTHAQDLAASAWIKKPFALEELLETVRRIFGPPRAASQ